MQRLRSFVFPDLATFKRNDVVLAENRVIRHLIPQSQICRVVRVIAYQDLLLSVRVPLLGNQILSFFSLDNDADDIDAVVLLHLLYLGDLLEFKLNLEDSGVVLELLDDGTEVE